MRVRGGTTCREYGRALPSAPQQICEEGGGKGWTQPFFFLHETLTWGSADLIAQLPWNHTHGGLWLC